MNAEHGRALLYNGGTGNLTQRSQWEWVKKMDKLSLLLLLLNLLEGAWYLSKNKEFWG